MAGATQSCISMVSNYYGANIVIFFSFSPFKDSQILIDFLMTVAKKYADFNHASKFIPDLLKVDVPELLHSQSNSLCQSFSGELREYINNHSLRNSFLKKLIQIMVNCSVSVIETYHDNGHVKILGISYKPGMRPQPEYRNSCKACLANISITCFRHLNL